MYSNFYQNANLGTKKNNGQLLTTIKGTVNNDQKKTLGQKNEWGGK